MMKYLRRVSSKEKSLGIDMSGIKTDALNYLTESFHARERMRSPVSAKDAKKR